MNRKHIYMNAWLKRKTNKKGKFGLVILCEAACLRVPQKHNISFIIVTP